MTPPRSVVSKKKELTPDYSGVKIGAYMAAPIIGAAAIGGAASLLGGSISGLLNRSSTRSTNRLNERLTREAWAREDNAVQRRAADMQAAGINPLLAAGSPAQASHMAEMKAPQYNNPDIDPMIIANAMRIDEEISMSRAQRDHIRSQIKNETAKRDEIKAHVKLLNAQTRDVEASTVGKSNENLTYQMRLEANLAEQRERTNYIMEQARTQVKNRELTDREMQRISAQILQIGKNIQMTNAELHMMPDRIALLKEQLRSEVARGNLSRQEFDRWSRNLDHWKNLNLYDYPSRQLGEVVNTAGGLVGALKGIFE